MAIDAWLPIRLHPILSILLEACNYATDAGRDIWDFSVELHCLRALGATNNDLRWLICKGFATPAIEITPADAVDRRAFRPSGHFIFDDQMCLVLTPQGNEFATAACSPNGCSPRMLQKADASVTTTQIAQESKPSAAPRPSDLASKPYWDASSRILQFKSQIIKQYRVPAPNQELVLSAFEEEGWPQRIDDPLPPTDDIDPRQRLHDTINRLNRNQQHRLIQFLGNGNGRAVKWQAMS
jgi:hypothetical protein